MSILRQVYAAQRRASLKAPNLLKIQRKRVKKERGEDGNESDDSVEDCLSDEEDDEDDEYDDEELMGGGGGPFSDDERIDGHRWERDYADVEDPRFH